MTVGEGTTPFDFPTGVEDNKVRGRALALLKAGGVRLPTFAELAYRLGAIEAPAGAEGPAADEVEAWLQEQGFRPRRIGLVEERPSIVGRLQGRGSGPTLVFNAHLDTAIGREDTLTYVDPAQPKYVSAWREGDRVYGNGVVNDKAPMACFLIAAAAIARSGVELAGDLILHAVPGEIGLEPVDEFQGPAHLGKDLGARYAIAHGVIGDAALVDDLKARIVASLGKPLKPDTIEFVADLPKTRNAKVMRRVLRAAYLGESPGDLSSLENPQAVAGIKPRRS